LDQDAGQVRACWEQLSTQGYFDLSARLPEFESRYGFVAGVSTHDDRLQTIKSLYEETGVLIDPHTADRVKVAAQFIEPGMPMLVLETALPAQFAETIQEAIGSPAPVPAHLRDLATLPQRVKVMECDVDLVSDYIKQIAPV